MTQFDSNHFTTDTGVPDGGVTQGRGFVISWQRGALAGDVTPEECRVLDHREVGGVHGNAGEVPIPCRRAPNGAFVEDVIGAALDRLTYYEEETRFSCFENRDAIRYLEEALESLASRQRRRASVGRAGTHETDPEPDFEARSLGEVADRQHFRRTYSWVGDEPVWVTRPSGSTEGPINLESAIDILLAEPRSQVHVVDPEA